MKDQTVNQERNRMRELREAFFDDPDYAIDCFLDGLTVTQAKAHYFDVLVEENKKLKEKGTATNGSPPIISGDTDDGSQGDFMTRVHELAAEKKISLTAATRQVRKTYPGLHEAFIEKSGAN